MQRIAENRRLLEAARGCLTLGLYQMANEELERMDRETRCWPEVLAVKLAIFAGLGLWDMVEIAAWQLEDCAGDRPEWTEVAENAKAATARERLAGRVTSGRPVFSGVL